MLTSLVIFAATGALAGFLAGLLGIGGRVLLGTRVRSGGAEKLQRPYFGSGPHLRSPRLSFGCGYHCAVVGPVGLFNA